MNARPILDRVIIEQDPAADKIGRFDLADTAKERPKQGTVVAVGPGAIGVNGRIPMECKVGDKVQYGEFAGSNITIDDKEYVIVKEGELLLIL